jgi:hypothetical protein
VRDGYALDCSSRSAPYSGLALREWRLASAWSAGQGGGRDCGRAEANSGAVSGGLDPTGFVIGGVEGELVVGELGGGEVVGAQGDRTGAGSL